MAADLSVRRGRKIVQLADPVALVTTTSLFVLVVNNRESSLLLFVGAAVAAVLALARPALARSPWLWLGAFAVMSVDQARQWEGVDDHVVLTTYWALALGLALLTDRPAEVLAWNARILAGLVFAFAAFWKLISPDFLSGDFFEYTLLLDDRFEYVAELPGGMSDVAYESNYARLAELHADPSSVVPLVSTERVGWVAAMMTGWGVVAEAGAALSLLLPLPRRWHWLRHVWLFAFAVTTYLVVPIGGFGLILLVLGMAQTEPGERKRVAYVAGMALLLIYTPIWRALFYS